MIKNKGFSLIELILFIVVTAILASTLLLAFNNVLVNSDTSRNQIVAQMTAQQCMEWFVGQRLSNGYSSIACPSTTVPSFCTAPSGYTISVNSACTTISSDANYKTITVTVSGNGDASLTTLIANY